MSIPYRYVAAAMRMTLTSAGFVSIVDNKFECWGESVSLKIKSGEAVDSNVLNRVFGLTEPDL